jgi:ureidoglycolate hydrolase
MSVVLEARALTADAFAPFGRPIATPARSADAEGPGWRWWGETVTLAADDRPYGVGRLELVPVAPAFSWAERHQRSEEAILPATDCLVYVAEAGPGGLPPLESFHVFHVPAGAGVILARGVWHGAPLAVAEPGTAVVLLLEGSGREDTEAVRFDETPVTIDPGSLPHARR